MSRGLSKKGSTSSILSTLLDAESRDGGPFDDDVPERGSWKKLRVGCVLPDNRRVERGRSAPEWAASAVIGHMYGEFLDAELRGAATSPLMTALAPWGTCLPVRITNMDEFLRERVGLWLEKYVPSGTSHPFTRILFYELMEPMEDEERQYSEDTRDTFDADAQRLMYVVELCVPVELEDVSPDDKRLPEAFFRSIGHRSGERMRYAGRAPPPSESWAIARPGQSIEPGVDYNEQHLAALDANPTRLNRFVDAYMRALYETMELERGTAVPSVTACKAVLAKDYWNLRFSCTTFEEFRAADARARLSVVLTYVYCYSPRSGLSDADRERFARRLENALIRFVRSEFLLGWSTEHAVVDLLNSYGLDNGRVDPLYTPAAGDRSAPTDRPARRAHAAAPGDGKEDSRRGDSMRALQSTLLTVQPTMREDLIKGYGEALKRAMPPIGGNTSQETPADLSALSRRSASGCISGLWVRNAGGLIEHRTGRAASLAAGESFVVAEGYPTRLYYVRNTTRGGDISAAYDKVARLMYKALCPRSRAPEPKKYSVAIGDSRSELVVYPGIVFTSLAALRAALGAKTQDVYHRVRDEELWRTLPACAAAVDAERASLLDPQPTVDETMHGVRDALMARVITEADGDDTRFSYDPDALHDACDRLRRRYASGHPTAPGSSVGAYGASRLTQPTIYWLRPAGEVAPVPAELLPPDATAHLDVLPRVDRHNVASNAYSSATILAYRDIPFMLAENIRAFMRECREDFLTRYDGDWERYLIDQWRCNNPTDMTNHTRVVLAALLGAKPISNIATTPVAELGADGSPTASAGAPLRDSSSSSSDPRASASRDADAAAEGDNAVFIALKRRRLELEREAAGVAARLRTDMAAVTVTGQAEPPQPNGLESLSDVRQRNVKRSVDAAREQMNVFAMAKALEPYMDDARKVPQRFIQAIWERPAEDPKRTIDTKPAPNASKPGEFFWFDRKSGVGHIGPLTLLAYTYAVRVGNAEYQGGESSHRAHRGPGYTDVRIADLVAIKERNKKASDAARQTKAADGTARRFDPSQLTGPLAFVRDVIEHVKSVSAGWPTPAESFTQWYARILDPFCAAIRREEEGLKRNKAEGRVNEELFDDEEPGAGVRAKDIAAPPPRRRGGGASAGKPAAPSTDNDSREVEHLWRDSLRLRTKEQSSYLRQCRGLDALDEGILEHSPFLRFVDSLGYKFYHADGSTSETQMHPALLAFCVGVTGVVGSLQRIYLQRRPGERIYRKLAPAQFSHRKNNVKRTVGALNYDSQFFLAQPGRVEHFPFVYLSEGPEKALAVAACSRFVASFASFGVGRYDKFEHFRAMEPQPTLVIAGDADHTIPHQEAKIEALRRAGWRNVIHWVPTCSLRGGCSCKDANDVIDAHGIWELRRSLGIPEWAWVTRFASDSSLYEAPEQEWRRYDFLAKYGRL